MVMFKGLRSFIVASLSACAVFTYFALAHAASTVDQSTSISSKDIIMILFGLLQTVFMGIGVWLISNDKELFTRVGKMEAKQATRDAICEERNTADPEHHHKRASDTDPQLALKESIDNLRKMLFSMENKDMKG